jgi:hypothetical protein
MRDSEYWNVGIIGQILRNKNNIRYIFHSINHHPTFHYSRIPSFHNCGGTHEETKKNESLKGSPEEKKC